MGGEQARAAERHELEDLGGTVRALRLRLGLTLGDVADRVGLSVPFLSQIETNSARPSLTSLVAVARVLETTPQRLLAGPPAGGIVLTRRDEGQHSAVTDAPRSADRRQLTGLGEPFSVAEYVVEPGTDLGEYLASDGRDLVHVIAGRLAIDLLTPQGVTTHELRAGDTLTYDTSTAHRWRHLGRVTTRLLQIVA
jgi:transcriptional regulator with XRE-family HTH domain